MRSPLVDAAIHLGLMVAGSAGIHAMQGWTPPPGLLGLFLFMGSRLLVLTGFLGLVGLALSTTTSSRP